MLQISGRVDRTDAAALLDTDFAAITYDVGSASTSGGGKPDEKPGGGKQPEEKAKKPKGSKKPLETTTADDLKDVIVDATDFANGLCVALGKGSFLVSE